MVFHEAPMVGRSGLHQLCKESLMSSGRSHRMGGNTTGRAGGGRVLGCEAAQ